MMMMARIDSDHNKVRTNGKKHESVSNLDCGGSCKERCTRLRFIGSNPFCGLTKSNVRTQKVKYWFKILNLKQSIMTISFQATITKFLVDLNKGETFSTITVSLTGYGSLTRYHLKKIGRMPSNIYGFS